MELPRNPWVIRGQNSRKLFWSWPCDGRHGGSQIEALAKSWISWPTNFYLHPKNEPKFPHNSRLFAHRFDQYFLWFQKLLFLHRVCLSRFLCHDPLSHNPLICWDFRDCQKVWSSDLWCACNAIQYWRQIKCQQFRKFAKYFDIPHVWCRQTPYFF